MPATTVQDLVLHGVTEEVLQREGAEEYMCSKPASLPFADDSPPCLGPGLESPSEAQVAERVAKRKSSLFTEMKVQPVPILPTISNNICERII